MDNWKSLIFYYNHNDIGDEIKVMHKTVHEFIRTQVEQSGLETASSG
jgi:hypothetical protein